MAIWQAKTAIRQTQPFKQSISEMSPSALRPERPADRDSEEEYHTAEDEASAEEYHTDPEDALEDGTNYNPPLLPTELLKSQPAEAEPLALLNWHELSRKEKKALRSEREIGMKELRQETEGTGVLEAGMVAQARRGVRSFDRVAHGRVAKTTKNKSSKGRNKTGAKPILSERQQLLNSRTPMQQQSGKGGLRSAKKKQKG